MYADDISLNSTILNKECDSSVTGVVDWCESSSLHFKAEKKHVLSNTPK